jgi:hypothetical protein
VTDEVVVLRLDLDVHTEEWVFLSPIGRYDMILGMPWVIAQDARINGPRSKMRIGITTEWEKQGQNIK